MHWSTEILDGAIRNLVADQQITEQQASRMIGECNGVTAALTSALVHIPGVMSRFMSKAAFRSHFVEWGKPRSGVGGAIALLTQSAES